MATASSPRTFALLAVIPDEICGSVWSGTVAGEVCERAGIDPSWAEAIVPALQEVADEPSR